MSLQHTEKFGLNCRAHFADFVQHQRAAICRFEFTHFTFGGTGKGTFLVTEQFAFQQALRQGGTVQADERSGAAGAGKMHGPCHEFLPHAAFATDQHRRSARRRSPNLHLDLLHRRALPHNFAFDLQPLAELQIFSTNVV